MPGTRRYPPEIRERAVRLVFEHEGGNEGGPCLLPVLAKLV